MAEGGERSAKRTMLEPTLNSREKQAAYCIKEEAGYFEVSGQVCPAFFQLQDSEYGRSCETAKSVVFSLLPSERAILRMTVIPMRG